MITRRAVDIVQPDIGGVSRARKVAVLAEAAGIACTPHCANAGHPHSNDPSAPLWPGRIPGSAGDPRGVDFDRQFDVGSVIRYYFKPALRELGLGNVRWHDLRHYYAMVMISQIGKGAPYTLYEVSRWMGHASYQTTVDVYGHLLETRPNVDILDDIMSAAEAEAGKVTPLRRIG